MSNRKYMRVLAVGSSIALAVGGFGLPGAAEASARPSPPGGPVAQATALPSGDSATYVGTSQLHPFTSSTSTSSTELPGQVSAAQMPHTPDVGDDSSSSAPVPASPSGGRGRHRHGGNGGIPGVGANPVTGATRGLTSVAGLDAYDQGVTHPVGGTLPGVDIEPPDQGLCSSGTYTLEVNNMVAKVFTGGPSGRAGQAYPLESLFDTPQVFGNSGDGTYSVQGDPRCAYDAATGHWFASELWLDLNATGSGDTSPYGYAGTFLAVSQGSDPTGKWNVFFLPDADNATGQSGCNNDLSSNPNANPCFGDQPLLGLDANTVQISTNEYSIFGAAPNGEDNLYFLSKSALESSSPAAVPVWWVSIGGTVPAPGGGPWYSLTPAQVPDGAYDTANGGTSYALSSLDFSGTGDNRIAEWAYTNTNAVNSSGPINIYEDTLQSGAYIAPPVAAQAAGPTPLGHFWNTLTTTTSTAPLPEGPIQTNDDRMTTVAVDPTTGALVGAINTGLSQFPQSRNAAELTGVAYFVVTPSFQRGRLSSSPVTTGYISPADANAAFPGLAIANDGEGVITYTLTGTGYYPSTAYSLIGRGDNVDPVVHVARAGAGPEDGFTEYQDLGTPSFRPRWGDYSTAVVVPGSNAIQFATEMINQSCTDTQFAADFTCGGTRDLFANWGTSVNQLTPLTP